MSHNKVVIGGAILVVLLVLATAGSVIASYNLHSSTTVEDNDIDSEFIVISTSTHSDLLDEVSFDTTVATDDTVSYSLNANQDIWDDGADTYGTDGVNDACLISNALTVNVAQTNVSGYYNLDVTVTGFTPIAGLTYTMKVGTQYCTYGQTVAGHWNFADLNFGQDYAVALYVSGTPTENPGSTVGFTNYDPDATPAVAGSIFTFLATAPNGAP